VAISIAWADSQDGTGGVATVAGADAATVTIYKQTVDATGLRSPAFAVAGTRSGNGTLTLTLAPGYYWIYAQGLVSGALAISNLAYVYATEATDALAARCVDAVAARLAGLSMAALNGSVSIPNDRIYKRTVAAPDGTMAYPCIVLSHEGQRESQEGTTTGKDDIGYPVNVWVLDRDDASREARRKGWLKWRQQVFRSLRNQRLAGVTEVLTVKVEPGMVFDPKLPDYQIVVLGFVVRVLCRELRGT